MTVDKPQGTPDAGRTARRADRLMRAVITAGGVGVILAVVSLLVVLVWTALPLFLPARGERAEAIAPPSLPGGGAVVAGIDEYRTTAILFSRGGTVEFVSLADGRTTLSAPIPSLAGATVTCGSRSASEGLYALGTSDGRVAVVSARLQPSFETAERTLVPKVSERVVFPLDPDGKPLATVEAQRYEDGGWAVAGVSRAGALRFARLDEEGLGAPQDLTPLLSAPPRAVAFDAEGTSILIGTEAGTLERILLPGEGAPSLRDRADASGDRAVAVTAVEPLLGGRSWAAGDARGGVSVWSDERDPADPERKRLARFHVLPPHGAGIRDLAPSFRNRCFLTSDDRGEVRLQHATTARTLLALPPRGEPGPVLLAYAPKGDGGLALSPAGAFESLALRAPHPEVSFRTLFGRVRYEGAEKPAWVWQSTGGTDDFEPKLSLLVLMFGTIKGALYALLFAVPIAVVAALYTSQFAHTRVRAVVKPTVELMAALPSVVVGFLAGLWLAPRLEGRIVGLALFVLCVPVAGLLVVGLRKAMGRRVRLLFPAVTEIALLVAVTAGLVALCLWIGPRVEEMLFGGDFASWLFEAMGVRYDQRNSVVVGIALGFAVIPVIFTIAEDALTNVPAHLTSASLALGANRWQTALRVVLPTASPGIFSAVMLGIGRAVGETMIVLMATGNTPIFSMSPWNGFRTLSANIAVEIPEAPAGGTLSRVLFLSAILLFFFTLFFNTVAELVSHRLRRRYGRL